MIRIFSFVRNVLAGRWYALYVSGHGCSFRRNGALMRRHQALRKADHWVGYACTIGGRSLVKNIFTGRIIYPLTKS